jgi:tetratricopeptide (TPR) repeat protein
MPPARTLALAVLSTALALAAAPELRAEGRTLLAAGPRKGGKGKRPAPRTAPPAAPRGKGVRQMFDYAQQLYDQGRYPQALMAFDALLKRYPGHEPAIIQAAKTLYRLERIKEAYAVFARIDPQHLDPETSYEYGWSFYTNKAYEGALYAFQRVPKGHALFDLANYYGAICAIKLKKYEDAEDMLEKAVVLPDKLAKSRALYIKHVQALRLMQQKAALAKERDQEKDQLAADRKKDKDKRAEAQKPAEAAPAGYVHAGKRTVDKSATVDYAVEHQYSDNHGLSETTSDARVTTFTLTSGPLIPITPWRSGKDKTGKDRTAAVGLELTLGAEDRITTGEEQRVLLEENDEDLTRLARTDLGTLDEKSGNIAAEPWIEVPLPEGVWVALGGKIDFTYPDFERGERFGARKGYAQIAGDTGPVTYFSEVGYAEILDEKTKPVITRVNGKVWVERDLIPALKGRLAVTHDLYDYPVDELALDGPDSVTRGEARLTQTMPFGFSAQLLGAYESQVNSVFHDVPPYGQVAADGNVLTGRLRLEAAPFSWLTGTITGLVAKTKWKLADEATREGFELHVADYLEQFTAKISVGMDFSRPRTFDPSSSTLEAAMADHEWLRNLAGARYVDGAWTHGDPAGVRDMIALRVDDAVQALFDEASEAAAVYNLHVRGARQLRVLQLGERQGGFLLLLGRCQLHVELVQTRGRRELVCTLIAVRGFERTALGVSRLTPHVDPFGSVAWQQDNALLMTQELIMKRLFEDLARASFEVGGLPPDRDGGETG